MALKFINWQTFREAIQLYGGHHHPHWTGLSLEILFRTSIFLFWPMDRSVNAIGSSRPQRLMAAPFCSLRTTRGWFERIH
jgi:hypothetical protein